MNKLLLLFVSFIFLLTACSEKGETDEIDVNIVRFDEELMALNSEAELQGFLMENPWYTKSLYRAFPEDTAFVNHLYYTISHPETRKFYAETDSSFGDLEELKAKFSKAFKEIKANYPDFVPPSIYTTFTGLENDLYVSDTIVIIALESFLGPKATYRPDQPGYILSRYQKEYIVPTVVRLMADEFIESTPEGSMLNDMIYFGKSFEFTKTMMPSVPDSIIISLPDSALTGNWFSQDIIWAHFIDKKLLYEQNQRVKEKYIGERPKVPEIGPACPGRVAQWLGWRIIQKFRTENPDVTFEELMKIKDPQEILRLSKYRGLVEE